MSKIVIIKNDESEGYLIDFIATIWQDMGHEVTKHVGARDIPPADIAFLHVDRTKVPDEYFHAVGKFPRVINLHVRDISRRNYSSTILNHPGEYKGPVIIKTNANYGGSPEYNELYTIKHHHNQSFLTRYWLRLKRAYLKRLPLAKRKYLNPLEYPIFDDIDSLPSGIWSNPNLVVEKFLPEKEGNLFFVRYWSFFGDKEWSAKFGSRKPVVKFGDQVTDRIPVPVPEELRRIRKKLRIDYGRFDYVVHDDTVYLLDVNKTQYGPPAATGVEPFLQTMASGIHYFETQ